MIEYPSSDSFWEVRRIKIFIGDTLAHFRNSKFIEFTLSQLKMYMIVDENMNNIVLLEV